MKLITVKTGFGYYTKDGRIVFKVRLPAGSHWLRDGYEYIEVADQAALDAIEVYIDPADVAYREIEQKIRAEIRRSAIDALKATGEIPADYEDR